METWWGECSVCGGDGEVIEVDPVLVRRVQRECHVCAGTGIDKNETRVYERDQSRDETELLIEINNQNDKRF